MPFYQRSFSGWTAASTPITSQPNAWLAGLRLLSFVEKYFTHF
jgi:hypothetical protein